MLLRLSKGFFTQLLAAVIALIMVSSCNEVKLNLPIIGSSATDVPVENTAQPAVTAQVLTGSNLTPLPIVTALLSPLPTPSGSEGVVVGRAFTLDGKTTITSTPAFLAKIYWNADHTNGVFALDINVAPQTNTQSNGDFIFTAVPEGEYTFVIGNPDRKTAVLSNLDGSAQTFMVMPGKVVSLGDVRMDY